MTAHRMPWCATPASAAVIGALASFSFAKAEAMELVPEHTSRALNREFEEAGHDGDAPYLLQAVPPRPHHHGHGPVPLREVHPGRG